MSAVVAKIIEKWLQDFVGFGNPCDAISTTLSMHEYESRLCFAHVQME